MCYARRVRVRRRAFACEWISAHMLITAAHLRRGYASTLGSLWGCKENRTRLEKSALQFELLHRWAVERVVCTVAVHPLSFIPLSSLVYPR